MLKRKNLRLLWPELAWIILLHLIIICPHLLLVSICLCLHINWRVNILNLNIFILSDSWRVISEILFIHHLLFLVNGLLLDIILVQLLLRILHYLFLLLELLIDLLLGCEQLLRIVIEILAINVAVLVHHHLIIGISFNLGFLDIFTYFYLFIFRNIFWCDA